MFVSLLLALAVACEPRIASAIHADAPGWRMTRHGFAAGLRPPATAPALGYDLPALAFFLRPQSADAAPRLDYAGYDQPGEWSEAELAALFVRDEDRGSTIEDPAKGADIMDVDRPADPAGILALKDDVVAGAAANVEVVADD